MRPISPKNRRSTKYRTLNCPGAPVKKSMVRRNISILIIQLLHEHIDLTGRDIWKCIGCEKYRVACSIRRLIRNGAIHTFRYKGRLYYCLPGVVSLTNLKIS